MESKYRFFSDPKSDSILKISRNLGFFVPLGRCSALCRSGWGVKNVVIKLVPENNTVIHNGRTIWNL